MRGRLFLDAAENIDILAFHGFGGDGRDFSLLRRHSSLRWGTLDLLGHGRSEKCIDPQDYDVENQVLACRDYDCGRVLLGYSMGARLALQLAVRGIGSWEALVLISGTAGLVDGRDARKQWDMRVAERLRNSTHEEFWSFWSSLSILQSQQSIEPEFQKERGLRRVKSSLHALAASMDGFGAGSMPAIWEELSLIDIPVLLIVGEADEKYRKLAVKLQQHLRRSECVVMPNCGHAPHLECPAETSLVIDSWFARQFSEDV